MRGRGSALRRIRVEPGECVDHILTRCDPVCRENNRCGGGDRQIIAREPAGESPAAKSSPELLGRRTDQNATYA